MVLFDTGKNITEHKKNDCYRFKALKWYDSIDTLSSEFHLRAMLVSIGCYSNVLSNADVLSQQSVNERERKYVWWFCACVAFQSPVPTVHNIIVFGDLFSFSLSHIRRTDHSSLAINGIVLTKMCDSSACLLAHWTVKLAKSTDVIGNSIPVSIRLLAICCCIFDYTFFPHLVAVNLCDKCVYYKNEFCAGLKYDHRLQVACLNDEFQIFSYSMVRRIILWHAHVFWVVNVHCTWLQM